MLKKTTHFHGFALFAAISVLGSAGTGCDLDGNPDDPNNPNNPDPCLPATDLQTDFTIAGNCDVTLPEGVAVSAGATLTIEAGATVRFAPATGLRVLVDGTLQILGTEEDPVTLTSVENAFIGVDIESSFSDNTIDHTVIENAGEGSFAFGREAALQLRDDSLLAANAVTVRTPRGVGVSLLGTPILAGSGLVVEDGANYAAHVDATAVPTLPSDVNFASNANADETKNAILVDGKEILDEGTWKKLDVPYELDGVLSIQADVVFDAGVEIHARSDASITVVEDGSLSAVGTEDERVVLSGVEGEAGEWVGVSFASNSVDNQLIFADVLHAGSDVITFQPVEGGVYIAPNAKVRIEDTSLQQNKGFGLVLGDDSGTLLELTHERVTYTDNEDGSVSLETDFLQFLDSGEESSYDAPITVRSGDVTEAAEWANFAVTVFFEDVVIVREDLEVGTTNEFAFLSDAYIEVVENGSLQAIADEQGSLIFRGEEEGNAGFWGGIFYNTNSGSNILNGVIVSDAGDDAALPTFALPAAIFVFDEASATIENCIIRDSDGAGIYIDDLAVDVSLEDNTFEGTISDGEIVDERAPIIQ